MYIMLNHNGVAAALILSSSSEVKVSDGSLPAYRRPMAAVRQLDRFD
jgi:hypothetical protein